MFAKTEAPTVIPKLIATSQRWKETVTQPNSPLAGISLRATLMWSITEQILTALNELDTETAEKAQEAGWMNQDQCWVYQKWSPEKKQFNSRPEPRSSEDRGFDQVGEGAEVPSHGGNHLSTLSQQTAHTEHARQHGSPDARCVIPQARGSPLLRHSRGLAGPSSAATLRDSAAQRRVQTIGGGPEAERHAAMRTLILRNPSNYCYMNAAFRTLLWALTLDATLDALCLRRGLSFAKFLFQRKDQSTLLAGQLGFAAFLQEWRSPKSQHDCAEFLHHVIRQFGPALFEGRWEARRVVMPGLRCTALCHGG